MDYFNKKSCLILILLISIFELIQTQKQANTHENRPYKFGFNIEGQQHRHEEKDEKGLVTGEFGFITADGVYHVTVYATDEQGRFKILSMKSIKVSPPLDGSPDYSNKPIQNINNNAVQAAISESSTPNLPISTINNFVSNQDYSTSAVSKLPENRPTITLQKPMNSCSSCSIPTTTKLPPPIAPQLPQQPGHSQLGLPNQIEVPKPINNQSPPSNINYPQSQPVNPNYPQQQNPNQTPVAAFAPSETPNQNYPQYQPVNPIYTQNYPNELSVKPNVPANPPSQELIAPFTPDELFPPNSNQNVPSSPEIYPFRPDGVPNDNFNSQPGPPNQQSSPFNPNNGNNYYTQSNPPSQELVSPFLPNNDNNYNQDPRPGNQEIPAPFVPGEANPNNEPNVSLPPELNISPLPPGGFVDNNYDLQPLNPTITTTINYNYQTTRKPSPIIPEGLHFPGLIHPPSDPPPGENPTMTGPMPPGVSVDDMRDLMYKFNYTVGFHGHYEVGYRSGVKIGAYFVNGRDGYSRIVEYTADELGFHPKVYYIYLGLEHPDIPKEETEKDYGLKGYIFEWYSIG